MTKAIKLSFLILAIIVLLSVWNSLVGKEPLAVATSSEEASKEAMKILEAGGTAADAFITAATIIGNLEPRESGIGGGFFAIYYDAEKDKVFSIDAREETPEKINPKIFLDKAGKPIRFFPERQSSVHAVGIPGAPDGFALLEKNFGKLKREKILKPAIKLAERGFKVDKYMGDRLLEDAQRSCHLIGKPRLSQFSATRELYFKPLEKAKNPRLICHKGSKGSQKDFYEWQVLEAGDTLKNPGYARLLKLLAEKGYRYFYSGEIARALLATIRGSTMSADDLKNYRAVFRKPVRTTYTSPNSREFEIYGMGPPSSGGIAIAQMLNMLGTASLDHYKISELSKIAFKDRNKYLADEDFIADLKFIKESLLSKEYAKNLDDPLKYISDKNFKAGNKCLSSTENLEHGTSHISISDRYGNVISATITIEAAFGSGIMVPGYGFLLNNELTDFEAEASKCNSIENGRKLRASAKGLTSTGEKAKKTYGGKRPRSSMAPTIVFENGKPISAIGAGGGPTIIGTVFQVFANLYGLSKNASEKGIEQAIQAPRLYNLGNGKLLMDAVLYDNKGLRNKLIKELKAAKKAMKLSFHSTAAQGITIDQKNHSAQASHDYRRGGLGLVK